MNKSPSAMESRETRKRLVSRLCARADFSADERRTASRRPIVKLSNVIEEKEEKEEEEEEDDDDDDETAGRLNCTNYNTPTHLTIRQAYLDGEMRI
ncbi:hypothetical protein T4E_5615 [Trichinella pseudospiralis]|uniref:Uncharacterized protein n=1 Tax=Trichinella pseudospiralis TaxID=6337 RepID=A0A0V0XRD9_TRIPS|nr:hypothetical protein T4E_5615 [Trichinella pseudospiralis]